MKNRKEDTRKLKWTALLRCTVNIRGCLLAEKTMREVVEKHTRQRWSPFLTCLLNPRKRHTGAQCVPFISDYDTSRTFAVL